VVREQFLVEIGDGAGVASLAELNRLFTAWAETVYHARPHSETGCPPMDRWLAGVPFPTPSPAQLRDAFLWSEQRIVSGKTATVKLFGGVYETDPVLAGRRVELVFDPFDLTRIEVRWNGKPYGLAIPQHIRRHAHPKAKAETVAPPPPTGIDYLAIIGAEHQAAQRQRINYSALASAGDGQQAPTPGGEDS